MIRYRMILKQIKNGIFDNANLYIENHPNVAPQNDTQKITFSRMSLSRMTQYRMIFKRNKKMSFFRMKICMFIPSGMPLCRKTHIGMTFKRTCLTRKTQFRIILKWKRSNIIQNDTWHYNAQQNDKCKQNNTE
jgi:hypothetical protein